MAQEFVEAQALPSPLRFSAGSIPIQREGAPAPDHPQGLPPNLRRSMEAMSGVALGDVRVRRDSPEAARLGALAYARGSEIHLGPGQEEHLPHEAWHVVQQRQGRVRANGDVGGVPLNDSEGLEREADRMGAAAKQDRGGSHPPALRLQPTHPSGDAPLQPQWGDVDFKEGDKLFGPSTGKINYNNAAQNLRKAKALSYDQEELTMGPAISYAHDSKDPENEPATNQKAFDAHYQKWLAEKPSRQAPGKKDSFKSLSKAAADFTMSRGKTVHFVQGDPEYAKGAADKSTEKGGKVTSHEMRYVYRNQGRLGSPAKFYSDDKGTTTSPPWENPDSKEAWDAYAERRKAKRAAK